MTKKGAGDEKWQEIQVLFCVISLILFSDCYFLALFLHCILGCSESHRMGVEYV